MSNHTKDFRLATSLGRGFAMGHVHSPGKPGSVTLSFTLSGGGISIAPMSVEDARAIAEALTEAADFASMVDAAPLPIISAEAGQVVALPEGELATVATSVAMIQTGRVTEARDQLAGILQAHDVAVPAPPEWVTKRDSVGGA